MKSHNLSAAELISRAGRDDARMLARCHHGAGTLALRTAAATAGATAGSNTDGTM